MFLEKFHLTDKIVVFSGDNWNTNFGGAGRKGTNKVFPTINKSLQLSIRGVGCAAHILHCGAQTSADILPVDIATVVNKIFQYFYNLYYKGRRVKGILYIC
jgi:hypothetical protein